MFTMICDITVLHYLFYTCYNSIFTFLLSLIDLHLQMRPHRTLTMLPCLSLTFSCAILSLLLSPHSFGELEGSTHDCSRWISLKPLHTATPIIVTANSILQWVSHYYTIYTITCIDFFIYLHTLNFCVYTHIPMHSRYLEQSWESRRYSINIA